MYRITLNFFINNKYQRPEIWATQNQYEQVVERRNDPDLRDNLICILGSGYTFAPKDIAWIDELDPESAWWKQEAPYYYWENLKTEKVRSEASKSHSDKS